MINFPVSRPRKKYGIDNYMTITEGRKVILEIDWVYWIKAWEVVISDPGTL